VIPDDYNGSAKCLDQLSQNVERSGKWVHSSPPISSPALCCCLFRTSQSDDSKLLYYNAQSGSLEQIRPKYETDNIELHIVGFSKVVDDLISGMRQMQPFFAATLVMCGIVLFW
jgi:uncharacterized protein